MLQLGLWRDRWSSGGPAEEPRCRELLLLGVRLCEKLMFSVHQASAPDFAGSSAGPPLLEAHHAQIIITPGFDSPPGYWPKSPPVTRFLLQGALPPIAARSLKRPAYRQMDRSIGSKRVYGATESRRLQYSHRESKLRAVQHVRRFDPEHDYLAFPGR